MKKFVIPLFVVLSFSVNVLGQEGTLKAQLDSAVKLIKSGKHLSAAQRLLPLSRDNAVPTAKPRIKYLLGLSLMELNLNQTAAFQFVDVIRSGDPNLTPQALEKLLVVTDKLGDETLLNFVIQRVEINKIPAANREMLYFRLGDIKHKAGQQEEAIPFYQRITSKSRYYFSALYNMGLAQAELNKTDEAIATFNRLIKARSKAKATDTNKVVAQMALARTYYQKQDWAKSIEAYGKIPRDHILWHAALFEKTWAMLRSARFRSTLSNFQSLHSSYYEDAYIPETLLLRGIVYLYICQYDEMEKVLSLYDTHYGPSLDKVSNFLANQNNTTYYNELNLALQRRSGKSDIQKLTVPYNIMKHVSLEGDVRRSNAYLKRILDEKDLIENNSSLKKSSVGEYAIRILNNRINSTRASLGGLVKNHLETIKNELTDLSEQAGFIRYEMLNGKKELLKKRIAGKAIKKEIELDQKQNREFYVENGYQYYPFQGEYWLDEVGNYHYLGKQSCE